MKKGDILELIDNTSMSAPIGSIARVIDVGEYHVHIEWIDKGDSDQMNGGYDSYHFKVIIPEKWCIKITGENRDVVRDWFKENGKQWGVMGCLFSIGAFYHNGDVCNGPGRNSIAKNHIEITFEQFKTHILKQKTVMPEQKLRVPITDVLKIYSVACTSWKSKIATDYLPLIDSEQNITFQQHLVDKMFKAATKEQLPVLEEVFGKQSKEPTLKEMAGEQELFADTPTSEGAMIEVRIGKEFKDKAFWLSDTFNWELKRDSNNQLCLIPTIKK